MKELRRNMRVVVSLMIILFMFFGAYFVYSVYFFGGRWFANPYNPRLTTQKQSVHMGTVTDRHGTVLAQTASDGTRKYAAATDLRRAVSHVIGDSGGKVANGVETFHAQYLLGFKANIIERIMQVFQGDNRRGDDIQLTLDARLNMFMASAFPDNKNGAAVVLNYKTGEVLGMISLPDFDPNNIDAALADELAGALVNRATQGLYPPGSAFKVVTMAAALANIPDVQSRSFECTGMLPVQKSVVTDANMGVHGVETMKQAFANSCNPAFATLTLELGYDVMSRTAATLGIGDNFLFRDLVVYNSSYPTSNRTMDDLAWSGVGQGRVLMTPLHMAMIAGCVANEGVMMEPRLLQSVTGQQGVKRAMTDPKVYRQALAPDVAAVLRDDMYAVVQSGTGTRARISGLKVGGKTGSAEASNDKTLETHAWFIGFISDSQHPYAIALVVEHGGSGGQVAAPLAAKILQKAVSLGL